MATSSIRTFPAHDYWLAHGGFHEVAHIVGKRHGKRFRPITVFVMAQIKKLHNGNLRRL